VRVCVGNPFGSWACAPKPSCGFYGFFGPHGNVSRHDVLYIGDNLTVVCDSGYEVQRLTPDGATVEASGLTLTPKPVQRIAIRPNSRLLTLETRNPKPETRNPKPKTHSKAVIFGGGAQAQVWRISRACCTKGHLGCPTTACRMGPRARNRYQSTKQGVP
jgi:hypothetical protein